MGGGQGKGAQKNDGKLHIKLIYTWLHANLTLPMTFAYVAQNELYIFCSRIGPFKKLKIFNICMYFVLNSMYLIVNEVLKVFWQI